MFFQELADNSQLYFLLYARVMALFMTAPVLSNSSVPTVVRSSLALMTVIIIYPMCSKLGYVIPEDGLGYVMLVLGEVILGVITGFFLSIIFAVFQLAGQMFAVQMGFGASQVFDPLAQVQIPVVGQLFNMVALMVFVTSGSLHKIFVVGIYRSFQAVKAADLLIQQEFLMKQAVYSIVSLFQQALIISFPILGTLILLSVTMGLLAKASPQMNLLMIGFPIQITVGFIMIFASMPYLVNKFDRVIEGGFDLIMHLFSGGIP